MEEARAFTVVIEIPAWSFRKVRWHEGGWNEQFRSPLPSPFNYGFVAEAAPAPPGVVSQDGEPLDVIVLGPRLVAGARVRVTPALSVTFLDGGCRDDKMVARLDGRPLRWSDRLLLRVFFVAYVALKRLRRAWRRDPGGRTAVLGFVSLEAGAPGSDPGYMP